MKLKLFAYLLRLLILEVLAFGQTINAEENNVRTLLGTLIPIVVAKNS